jgi:hypothetical protein
VWPAALLSLWKERGCSQGSQCMCRLIAWLRVQLVTKQGLMAGRSLPNTFVKRVPNGAPAVLGGELLCSCSA